VRRKKTKGDRRRTLTYEFPGRESRGFVSSRDAMDVMDVKRYFGNDRRACLRVPATTCIDANGSPRKRYARGAWRDTHSCSKSMETRDYTFVVQTIIEIVSHCFSRVYRGRKACSGVTKRRDGRLNTFYGTTNLVPCTAVVNISRRNFFGWHREFARPSMDVQKTVHVPRSTTC